MAVLNKVYLMGNLTRDTELRYTPSGTAVCEFGIAVNRRTSASSAESRPEDTCFVDITAWDKLADICSKYLMKGSSVFIEGRLQYDSWTDKDQKKRSRLRVVAENVQFIGARREGGNAPDGGAPYEQQYRRAPGGPEQGAPQYGRQRSYAQQPYGGQQQSAEGLPPQMPPSREAYGDRQAPPPRQMMPPSQGSQVPPPMDTGASGMNDVQGIEDDIPF